MDKINIYNRWDIFWAEESQHTLQTHITADTRGIVVDFAEMLLKEQKEQFVQEAAPMVSNDTKRLYLDGFEAGKKRTMEIINEKLRNLI